MSEGLERNLEDEFDFVDRLNRTLRAVLPLHSAAPPMEGVDLGNAFLVKTSELSGIPLTVKGRKTFVLRPEYRCIRSESNKYLAVEKSSIWLFSEGITEPLLHFDFLRTPVSAPSAHINFHADSDALAAAIRASGQKARMKRGRRSRGGKRPQLHLPLGGPRFRPSLEDVLQMVIYEFGIDARDGWKSHLRAARAHWRTIQLRAAIHDNPGAAAETLAKMGYQVSWIGDGAPPSGHPDRVEVY